MLTVVLGFSTALVYGFADFFGAIAARRIRPVTVTAVSGAVGLVFLITLIPIFGFSFNSEAIAWGFWAGLWSAVAMTCLYASLALGPISIVSPLGAVVSAIVPAGFGLLQGESFSAWGYLALALLLVAVALVGFVPGAEVRVPTMKALLLGIAAGAGIGAVLICLDQAPEDSGLTPVVMLRAVSASLLGLFLLAISIRIWMMRSRQKVKPAAKGAGSASDSAVGLNKLWLAVIAAGLFDSSANVFFLLASREGSLTIVSVLTALYPLGTIILARFILKEKIARTQQVGILLALSASAILAIT